MKKILSILLIILVIMPSFVVFVNAEGSKIFSDVNISDWYYENVMEMANSGFIKGYDDGTFRPNEFITWAELTTLLLRALNNDQGSWSEPDKHWASRNMDFSYTLGWYDEGDGGTYFYDEPINRAYAARTIIRAIKEPCGDIWSYKGYINDLDSYEDYVLAVYSKGIMGGDGNGNFNPHGNLTRAEACAIIDRAVLHEVTWGRFY